MNQDSQATPMHTISPVTPVSQEVDCEKSLYARLHKCAGDFAVTTSGPGSWQLSGKSNSNYTRLATVDVHHIGFAE